MTNQNIAAKNNMSKDIYWDLGHNLKAKAHPLPILQSLVVKKPAK